MSKSKKVLKIIRNIFIVILALFIIGSGILFIVHRKMLSDEKKLLEENNLINPVSVGEYNLNVYSYGSDSPKHTIVGIAGLGMHNISLKFHGITDRFADENKIVIIDRAGYGASDDTKIPQTAERIVEDYRTALKNAGFQAPYILLPHSIGSIYSTYWASKYPDEIEGIVYIDGTQLNGDEVYFEGLYDPFTNTLGEIAFKIGYQRLVYTAFDPAAFKFTEGDERKLDKALTWKNALSVALDSEAKLINENCRFVYDNIVKNDIPKEYICASAGASTREEYIEYRKFMHEQMLADGMNDVLPEFTDEYVDEQLKMIEDFRRECVYPFTEKIGNCEIDFIAATHMVYCDYPDKCADVIEKLIKRIDG